MSSFYVPVRIATMVVSGILFILAIIDLVNQLNYAFGYDTTYVVQLGITIVVLFVGVYGSFKHDRVYLNTFALIVVIVIILGCFTQIKHYGSLSTSIVLLVLALTQAELIKRGYH